MTGRRRPGFLSLVASNWALLYGQSRNNFRNYSTESESDEQNVTGSIAVFRIDGAAEVIEGGQ